MNTNYPPYKNTLPTEAEVHLHAKDRPHLKPGTMQKLFHEVRKAADHRKNLLIKKLKD